MQRSFKRAVLLVAGLVAPAMLSAQTVAVAVTELKVGDMAPDFTLAAATMKGVSVDSVKLSSLRGKTVVLAFFPRARTGGCTIQMRAYRDQYATIFGDGKTASLFAISTDSASATASWASDEKFPFTFLSDVNKVAGKLYGTGSDARSTESRVLFVIGADGKITHIMRPFREIDPTSYTDLSAAIAAANKPVK